MSRDLISSLAVFLVNQLRPLVAVAEQKTNGGSGPSLPEPLAYFDRDGCSPRMFQGSLLSTEEPHLPKWSETFGGSVMWDGAYLYRLPTWEPCTDATASGSLGEGWTALTDKVAAWGTPAANDAKDCQAPTGPERSQLKHSVHFFARGQMPLLCEEQMELSGSYPPKPWQTPRANDAEKRGDVLAEPRMGLIGDVKAWATPVATHCRGWWRR